MKLQYAKLINYAGLYRGSNLNIVEIDFTKQKHKLCFIVGKNKSGKTTLMNALNPLPDDNNSFLKETQGEKHLRYIMDNGEIIKIVIIHPLNKKGDRGTTKASFQKLINGDFVELNPNGNIGSYKELVESYFGLDASFLQLSKLSIHDKGIVEKSPSERKKFVTSIIENLDTFNDIGKTMTKRVNTLKAMINTINSKIQNVGDRDNLNLTLESVNARIEGLNNNRNNFLKEQSKYETLVDTLDPDKTITTRYNNLITELNNLNVTIITLENQIGDNVNIEDNKKMLNDKITLLNDSLSKYDKEMIALDSVMPNILAEHEEQSRSIELKTQRLNNLQSETNYNKLLEVLENDKKTLNEYENIFRQMNISDPLSISKDEYVTALNVLRDIKDSIDSLRSGDISRDIILTALDYVMTDKNAYHIKASIEKEIRSYEINLSMMNNSVTEYKNKLLRLEVLKNRPDTCNIDSCIFISEALQISKEDPNKRIDELSEKIEEYEDKIADLNSKLFELEDIISYTNYLRIIKRDLENNKDLLAKLPHYEDSFSSLNLLVDECINGNDFNIMESIYNTITNANLFDLYRNLLAKVQKAESEMKIYETKNNMIDELMNDLTELKEKTTVTVSKLNDLTFRKNALYQIMLDTEDNIKKANILMDAFNKIEVLYTQKNELIKNIGLMEKDSENIRKLIVKVNEIISNITLIDKELKPLEKTKSKVEYSLRELDQYESELELYTRRYIKSEKIRYYSVPKSGIQLIFMDMYMHKAIRMCNTLLEFFFNGDLQLTEYVLDETKFSLPCYDIPSGITNSDVSDCSASEKCIIGTIMNYALLSQSATNYNIIRMDEPDAELDQENRLNFVPSTLRLMDLVNVEQALIISHSSENEYNDVDMIKLSQSSKITNDTNSANIIFDVSKKDNSY